MIGQLDSVFAVRGRGHIVTALLQQHDVWTQQFDLVIDPENALCFGHINTT